MRYIFYVIEHIDEMHPGLQMLIYGTAIAIMCGMLAYGKNNNIF